jgi:phage anti-repressor protein
VSSTSKTYTIDAPSGPVEFPSSASPNGKFEGIDGRDIHGQIKSSTLYTQWAIRTIHRLKLRKGKDYSRHSGAGPNGGATAEYLFSPKSTASILATARSRSASDTKIPAVVAQQDTKKLEEQIEAALPLLETLFGDEAALSVDARELHAALAVRKDFTNWIKNQLERGQWVEGRDFAALQIQGENPMGGRPSAEYALSLDVAKHIAMMSQCRLGFAAREYFIRVEREFRREMRERQHRLSSRELVAAAREKRRREREAYLPPTEPLFVKKRIKPHLVAKLRSMAQEVGKTSERYSAELTSFVAHSALRAVRVQNFEEMGQMDFIATCIFLSTCLDCFAIYEFDPTWEIDGLLDFEVENSVRTLLHPRIKPFPKRRNLEMEEEIIRHAETVENPYLYLLPPEPKALPSPSVPLEQKETTVTSVIASVATFGGEASGRVVHREGKPYMTLELPVDEISAFWQHAHGAEELSERRR